MIGYSNFGYGMGFFGGLFMVLFWGAIIWLIIWIVKKNKQPIDYHSNKTSLGILKERFARGEISKKEYINMKSEL